MGYYLAGFRIVGVDNRPMPRYPFTFVLADALEYVAEHGHDFDAIHASPPCQFYSRLRYLPWLRDRVYWRSIPPTRAAIEATGKPYVIENVEDAKWDMVTPAIICGYSLGLDLYRHRAFETWPFALLQPGHHPHKKVITPGGASLGKRHHGQQGFSRKGLPQDSQGFTGHDMKGGIEKARLITGIDWMTGDELAQAIPPTYTEFVGLQMRKFLGGGLFDWQGRREREGA